MLSERAKSECENYYLPRGFSRYASLVIIDGGKYEDNDGENDEYVDDYDDSHVAIA